MDVPDYIEPIVGWRMWCTTREDERTALRSVNRRTVWPRGAPLVADCLRGRIRLWPGKKGLHAPPGGTCGCGIYASEIDALRGYLAECLVWGWVPVIGTVALWGKVYEHERGWRAEVAYPQSLFVPVANGGSRRALAAARDLTAYGVPVSLVDTESVDTVLRDVVAHAGA